MAASLLDGNDGKAGKAADGSWVGLRFGRAHAGDVRDKLRLMAAGAWQQILKSPISCLYYLVNIRGHCSKHTRAYSSIVGLFLTLFRALFDTV